MSVRTPIFTGIDADCASTGPAATVASTTTASAPRMIFTTPSLHRHDLAEPLPGLAVETGKLHVLDREKLGGRRAHLDAGQQHGGGKVEMRRLLHDVFSRQIVAALLQDLNQRRGHA